MNWLRRLIEKLFRKKEIKLIEAPKHVQIEKDDFKLALRQHADLERSDGNGYRIIKRLSLKDMV